MKLTPKCHGVLLALALVVATVAAYWPAMQNGGFIWDDDDYIINNQTLKDVSGLKDIWIKPQATPQYYPLVHTSYWIEYRFWELDPTGYHVTNVLLHALAAVLLWCLLKRLKIPGAWLASALFAIHPVHVESVAWITERKNVLSAVFYLGAAWYYLKWADSKATGQARRSTYIGALILFVCALLSKTVTSSLPAALLLVAWWKADEPLETGKTNGDDSHWFRRHVLPLLPFFFIGLAMSAITVWLEMHHVGAKGAEWDLSFIERCLIAGRALWFYAGKLLWPSELSFNYFRWEIDAGVWWQYLYPLAVAGVVAFLWFARKRHGRGPLVAVLFFAGTLFPALGFFDVYPMRYSFVADHFQYLASIGILVLVAALVSRLASHHFAQRVVPAIALLVLGVLSWKQCWIYRNVETLWLDTIARNPTSFMAYNNLGKLHLDEGRLEKAIPFFEESLRHYPMEATARNNLGVTLAILGRFDEAKKQYDKAISDHPDDPQAYHNLGVLFARQRQNEKAIEYYRKAVDLNPKLVASHINLGMALAELGKTEEAIAHHEKAVATEPKFATGYLEFGKMLYAIGRKREAADQYRKAISLDPSLAVAHNDLGMIAVADQLIPAAIDHFQNAVKSAPDTPQFHVNLAKALAATNQFGQADKHFGKAVSLAPKSGPVRFEYANFLVQKGDKVTARKEYLAVSGLLPNSPDPLFQAGVMDLQLGDTVAAEKRFFDVLKLAPDHAAAHNHLAVLFANQGNNERAIEFLSRAVTLTPENAEFHNNLGVIMVRAGKLREALGALEEAVRLQPDYGEAQKNLDDLKRLMKSRGQP